MPYFLKPDGTVIAKLSPLFNKKAERSFLALGYKLCDENGESLDKPKKTPKKDYKE